MKEKLRDFALSVGADMCGVAGVDRFYQSPKGKHPTDILPGCKSVIVIGIALLDGIIQANFRDFEDGRRDLKGLYGQYGYSILPNFALTYGCYAIAKFIEKSTGEVATPLSTGPMTNGAQTSIRHAAAAAGLGEFGWMGIILTPEYGPRNRFGVILTTLELEPDSMYSGQRLCNPEKCGICAAVCPTGALEEYGEGVGCRVKVGDREYNYTQVNWARCFLAEHAMTTRYGGRENFIDPNNTDPSMAEVGTAMAKMPPSEMGLQHHESHHCGKCLSYCPAGKWGEKFKKRGLTGGAAAIKFPE